MCTLRLTVRHAPRLCDAEPDPARQALTCTIPQARARGSGSALQQGSGRLARFPVRSGPDVRTAHAPPQRTRQQLRDARARAPHSAGVCTHATHQAKASRRCNFWWVPKDVLLPLANVNSNYEGAATRKLTLAWSIWGQANDITAQPNTMPRSPSACQASGCTMNWM